MLNTVKAVGYLIYVWFKENFLYIFSRVMVFAGVWSFSILIARYNTDRELEFGKSLRLVVPAANPCEHSLLITRGEIFNYNLESNKSSLNSKYFFIRWTVSEEWRDIEPIQKPKGKFECK